jgi:UDP-N-acetylmuramoyl-L-alanyl-D-glutamate--2,6-diaminopimelate ligase
MQKLPARLPEILAQIPKGMVLSSIPDVMISGISIDSRRVGPGDMFVALRGAKVDGHAFVEDAISRGAGAVAAEEGTSPAGVPYVRLRNAREALSWIAAAFHGWPARHLTVIGITGTDGKTTTANLIHRILLAAGIKAGMISTVNAIVGQRQLDTGFHVTTPDAHDLQMYLAEMVAAGLTHVVLETTSHGWAQHRVDACEFDVAVVTNITHEHLDEHGSYENYRAAKARLFTSLARTVTKTQGNPRAAILNRDDGSFEYLDNISLTHKVCYGESREADVRAEHVYESPAGVSFDAVGADFRVAISTPLKGRYNVSNCLAAISATVVAMEVAPEVAAKGIAGLAGVQGRMESIDLGQDFTAIVDFAHTPNALRVTLKAARELLRFSSPQGRVIAVFGSAGLRDRQKRRMMAEISAELADLTVLTAEDPRTESLGAILADMAEGASSRGEREGATFWRIPDRGEAIRFAVMQAKAGDIVLACGKGHEQSMCFGSVEHPWDDVTALRAALAERLGVSGPTMPYLPTRDRVEADWLK